MISLTQLATEALGVPDNLIEVSEQVYEEVMYYLSKITDQKLTQKHKVNVTGPFTVGDVTFDEINITLDVQPIRSNKVVLLGGAYSFQAGVDQTKDYKRLVYEPTSTVDILVNIGLPEEVITDGTWETVADFVAGPGRKTVLSTLAHEIKHAHDQTKLSDKGEKIVGRLKYSRSTDPTGLGPVDEFNYYIYYTYFLENLVRPTEFAIDLKYKGVTKKGFLRALKSSEVYKNLKKAQSYSYDEMIKKLLQAAPKIRKAYEDAGWDLSKKTDEQLIDDVLKASYKQKLFDSARTYANHISRSVGEMMELILGPVGKSKINQEKKDAFEEVVADINRYDNYKDFYKNEEKKIKREADKVLRRLAKLYAYID